MANASDDIKSVLTKIMKEFGNDISMTKYQAVAIKRGLPHYNTVIRNIGGTWEKAKEIILGVKKANISEQIVDDKENTQQLMSNNLIKKKYRKLLKEKVLQDELIDLFRLEIKALPTVVIPKKIKIAKAITKEESLMLISDSHIGEIVSAEETAGFGNYDFDIFNARIGYFFEKSIDLIENKMQGYDISKMNIVFLGDMISGIIHDELVENSEDTVIEWVLHGALIFSQFLIDMARHFPEVEVTGVIGNHGRLTKQVRFKKKYANWDYLMYQIIAIMCINQKNISFDFPKSFFVLKEIAGQTYLILHGDNVQMYKSIPWYGIERMITSFSQLLASQNKIIQHVLIAHFHNQGVLDKVTGEIVLNGSIIGGNEYSLGKLFRSSDPKQLLMGVNPKYGPTWRFPINLKEANDSHLRYTCGVTPINEQIKLLL